MFLWAWMCEGKACCGCRICYWQSGMFVLIRERQASWFLDAVSVPGLSWIQLWLVAFVAGSGTISCPAFPSAPQGLHGIRGEPSVVWGSADRLPRFTNKFMIAMVTSCSWGPGDLAENICLHYLVFCRCSFWWRHDGGEDRSKEILGEFTPLLPLPTAHNSRSICTALPLRAYHSDAL